MRHRLKYHWFNVQTNDLTGKDNSGALDRQSGWRDLKRDIRCQIQQVNKGDASTKYDIKVANVLYVLYFDDLTFSPDASCRFLINKSNFWNQRLEYPYIESNILILEFKGTNTNYTPRVQRKTVNEIYAEHNKRWKL